MPLNVLIMNDSERMQNVIRRIVNLSGSDLGVILAAENGR